MEIKILPPAKAIKQYLLEDVCGSHKELREYGGRWDFGKGTVKDIRLNCIECSAYELGRVRNCECPDCPLYPYRMGHNPNRKGIGGNKNIGQLNKKKKDKPS